MILDPKALEAAVNAVTRSIPHERGFYAPAIACAAVEAYLAACGTAEFPVGQRVLKHSGDYEFSGEVRGTVTTTAGAVRVVVEHQADRGGLLHIYAPRQLRAIDDGATP